jgi:putative flippase GtrA
VVTEGGSRARLDGLLGEIGRFGIVGGLAFGLDAAVLALIIHLGASPYTARGVSVAAAIVFTWWLNRQLTFRTAAPSSWAEFRGYVLQSLFGAGVNYAVYATALYLGTGTLIALIFGTGTASAFNFVRYRKLLKPVVTN